MLLDHLAELIRHSRAGMDDLSPIDIGTEFEKIYGRLDENDFVIDNEFHRARGFRKLHLETAIMGGGLDILHCVFFPDPTFDLPIFGVDIVNSPSGISAAIVDLSPVSSDLPKSFISELERFSFPPFKKSRELPSWGDIFSGYVKFVRPEGEKEEQLFFDITEFYLKTLIKCLREIKPDLYNSSPTINRYKAQQYYCLQQKQNDKTRNLLMKAFNAQWADLYMEKVLFDSPPSI